MENEYVSGEYGLGGGAGASGAAGEADFEGADVDLDQVE